MPFLVTELKKKLSWAGAREGEGGGAGGRNCLTHGKHNKDFQQKNKFRFPEDIQKTYHLIFIY